MDNPSDDFFPVHRDKGVYSGSPRKLEAEYNDYVEPDPDDPESWLTEERHEESFKKFLKDRMEPMWRDVDFSKQKYYVCGQSHIDVAWKWRYWQTLRKTIVTYKKAVWHVNNHPTYTFAASQPQLLAWIKEVDPELFFDIQEAVAGGRFDLVGGMWVEPDCHLPSGEAFVRQRLYGQKFYMENFGRLSIVEWVPDSFGYANQLPQIFIKSGTPYFMSTKLCGNSYSTFPFVNFMWESPDGSQVLAYQNPGGLGPLSRHLKFDPLRRLLKAGTSLRVNYSVDRPESMDVYSDEIPPVACFTGKGDGGHGPTGEELAAIDVLVAEKGARWITPSEYFTTKLAKHEDRLPVWNDELYYEYHRGTPTTHALVKRMNRYFECRLCVIEALASTATLFKDLDQDIWSEDLEIAWKFTCLNQFHDVLPGSSIPEVYDDVYEFWEMTKAVLDQVELEAWNAVLGGADAEKGDLFYAFNGTGFDVEHVLLELPLDSCAWVPSSIRVDGKDTPVQVVEADTFGLDEHFVSRPRRVITTASIKQHAFSKMQLSKVSPPDDNASKAMDAGESLVLDNSLYSVRVSKVSGNITSIFDKSLGKEVLVAPGIQLEAYYDWHVTEQAWNIGPGYQQMPIEVRHPSRVEITEKGPVRWTVEIERTVHNPDSESDANAPSAFLQRVSLVAGSPGIHVEFLVDWHSCEAITKLNVHTATGATEIVSETPYGTIHRLINPVANHDVPRWENTHQTWFDVPAPDGSWGIAVINNGKYGHDAKDGRAGLTLLRGPLYPTASGESWVHQERKERADAGLGKVPTHADLGKHLIRLALVPHTGTWDASRPFIPALAHWFNDGGSISCAKPHADDEFVTFEVARVDDRAAEITAIKPAEDGVGCVLRVVEVAGKSGLVTVKINPYLAISSVVDADLLERPLDVQELSTVLDPNDTIIGVSFHAQPHEIKTIILLR